eukprot:330507-Rhodomonas_salina.1
MACTLCGALVRACAVARRCPVLATVRFVFAVSRRVSPAPAHHGSRSGVDEEMVLQGTGWSRCERREKGGGRSCSRR